ncbi:hypothetical protein Goklo_020855 [Gossypium klotzschianum]|uniref:Zinc knuckle CX2CX4HX4C domain-containing protein n=1 Tax=Gossypium klotzschianum TaxID=34286 RepID=A0A7J8UTF3_9ROSI|nr:hypothetical protein [Gossypium klotzschianum]
MEDAMANLKLLDDEEEVIHEVAGEESFIFQFCLVVHDLPPGSMNESMAKQFGNFCGEYLEVRLDVTAPLKRKKKVLFRKSLIVYARFKYEKLCLFCFICGRLGHGESFCPLRLQIEPSKIIFGWDLSLRAASRHRNTMESR